MNRNIKNKIKKTNENTKKSILTTINKVLLVLALCFLMSISLFSAVVLGDEEPSSYNSNETITEINEETENPLISLYTEKSNYELGEKIDIYLINNVRKEVVLTKGGCEEWFKITDKEGNILPLYDSTKPCILLAQTLTIGPGEKKFLGTWDQKYWKYEYVATPTCQPGAMCPVQQKAILVTAQPGAYQIRVDTTQPANTILVKQINILGDVTSPGIPPEDSQKYLEVTVVPRTNVVEYTEAARYQVVVKDKHPGIRCIRAPCPQPVYTYNVDVKDLPIKTKFPPQISVEAGSETKFELIVKPYFSPIEAIPQVSSPVVSEKSIARTTVTSAVPASEASTTKETEEIQATALTPITPAPQIIRLTKTQVSEMKMKEEAQKTKETKENEKEQIKTRVAMPATDATKVEPIPETKALKVSPEIAEAVSISEPSPVSSSAEPYPSVVLPLTRTYNFRLVVYSNELNEESVTNLKLIINPNIPKPTPQPPTPPEFPEDYVMIKLQPGWNLVSFPGRLENFEIIEKPKHKLIGFVFIKETQKYLTLKEARDYLGDRFDEYLAQNAFWIYSYEPYDLVAKINSGISYEDIILYPTWNLLPITEDMVYGNLLSMIEECDVEKIYLWDAYNQKWQTQDMTTPLDPDKLYQGLAVKVKNKCTLQGGAIIQPPFFPDEDKTTPEEISQDNDSGNGSQGNFCKNLVSEKTLDWDTAKKIALNSECLDYGTLGEEHWCNEITGTAWFTLNLYEPKEGCNPACVVNVDTRKAEINWMCTGLKQE